MWLAALRNAYANHLARHRLERTELVSRLRVLRLLAPFLRDLKVRNPLRMILDRHGYVLVLLLLDRTPFKLYPVVDEGFADE